MSKKRAKARAFKQWVVLRFVNGAVAIVPDNEGFTAWDSVRYDVAGCFKTKREAAAAAAKLRAEADRLEKAYGDPKPGNTTLGPKMKELFEKMRQAK